MVGCVEKMADPPKKGEDGKKMPWGMKIAKLKPGARETITDKKLATFVVGKQKKSRLQKVRQQYIPGRFELGVTKLAPASCSHTRVVCTDF